MASKKIDRRTFLAASTAVVGSSILAKEGISSPPGRQPVLGDIKHTLPTMTLGRTGRVIPRLGMGTFPIGMVNDENAAVEALLTAMQFGVRYFDTAPTYTSGRAEYRLGLAMAASGIDRSEFYIATKTKERDGAKARQELEESLVRLGLDYVDVVQVHQIHDDVDQIFGPGQVLEALVQARADGLTKFIGISSHAEDPQYINYALQNFQFDTILVAANPTRTQFIEQTLPIARDQNLGVIFMKIYQSGYLITIGGLTPQQCVGFALDVPGVHVIIPGFDDAAQIEPVATYVASHMEGYASGL